MYDIALDPLLDILQCLYPPAHFSVHLHMWLVLTSSPAVCTKPKVKSSTYSTENHYFSSESAFIAQVEVDCGGEVHVCTLVLMQK